jgi:hypothetical protein
VERGFKPDRILVRQVSLQIKKKKKKKKKKRKNEKEKSIQPGSEDLTGVHHTLTFILFRRGKLKSPVCIQSLVIAGLPSLRAVLKVSVTLSGRQMTFFPPL